MPLLDQARRLAPELSNGTSLVYILRLQSGGLYVGCSTDFENRFRAHSAGLACRTTRLDPATEVLWIEIHENFGSVRAREIQIKKWSRAKKEALVSGQHAILRSLARSTK
jgi:predicted GIY-YIG superfamily endonuclease